MSTCSTSSWRYSSGRTVPICSDRRACCRSRTSSGSLSSRACTSRSTARLR
ncbi:unnamed protein product [Ectocarpus fasciculatus]